MEHTLQDLAQHEGATERLTDAVHRPQLHFRLDHWQEPIARGRHVDRREDRRLVLFSILNLTRLSLERELNFTDLHNVAILEHDRLRQPQPVDVRSSCTANILEQVLSAAVDYRRMPPGDRFRLQHQIAIRIAPDDHDIAIDLVHASGQGTGDDLKERNDALIGFHDGLFPWSSPLMRRAQNIEWPSPRAAPAKRPA